ncbi:MAG: sigma-70 family RNA polymerase sigma factor [Solirubrobacterales bacterium]|nr:sigma-70 family RNA polymerase sigma factor [Solirubrobacterales bacterium]
MSNTEISVGIDDVGKLYGLMARRLEQLVRQEVRAPEAVIEDACQFAWGRLLHHHHRVQRETVMNWLVRTAVHEALKLLRRAGRELSLDADDERATAPALSWGPTPAELIERGEQLAGLKRLPVRQQRALWLQALGFDYAEIARHEGCTRRTVERQLLRARQGIRELEAA